MLLSTLGANLSRNLLTGKGVKAKMSELQANIHEQRAIRTDEGRIKAGQDF